MAIPMLGLEDIVGKRFESCEIDVVEELREGKGVLFAIFPIGATMQDGGKRKRSGAFVLTLIQDFFLINPKVIEL